MRHRNPGSSEYAADESSSVNSCNPGTRPRLDPDVSVLRQLLSASKEAEGLIACLFELHFISAIPLEQIWEKFAGAIKAAQQRLQQHDRAHASTATDRNRQGGL